MNKTQRITRLALTVAVAMLLSYIESCLPSFTAVPGIKMGLANIAVIFALYRFGLREAVVVSLTRVFLMALLFGSVVSMLYGLAGAVVSILLMELMRRFSPFSTVGVSVLGGVAHNAGQIGAACIILKTDLLVYYMPILIISGTLAGIVTGIAAGMLIKRLK